MLRNYLKIALRNLRRHAGYSFINIAGLAMGLACCVLIGLFVRNELSYDAFHSDADRVYRVVTSATIPNAPQDFFALTSRPIGAAIRQEYPEAEAVVRLTTWNPIVKDDGQYFYDDDFISAEPALFDVFSFKLLKGDPKTALSEPYSVVLTETTASKYFGELDPVGETLVLNDTLNYRITGIVEDVPENSHFTFDALTSWITGETNNPVTNTEWLALGTYTYVRLKPDTDAQVFESKISDLIMRNFGEQLRSGGIEATVGLEPLTEIYLHSDRKAQIGPTGDVRYIYVFSAIAVFVLLIACINFMNLATARSMERAREVGVRKVVGSSRTALIRQFLSESTLLAVLAMVVSFFLIAAALPLFNEISGKNISFWALISPTWLVALPVLTIVVGFLAGSYPALALSGFRPVEVLKGSFARTGRGVRLRQALVVFQFATSVALIVGTLIVTQQLDYMKNQDLGFDRDQVVVVDATGVPGGPAMANAYRTVKQELGQHPAVRSVSASATVPGRNTWLIIIGAESLPEGDTRRARIVVTDHDYIETMDIEIAAGRMLSEDFATDDTAAALVNESAVENLGWGSNEEALGKWVEVNGNRLTVVGVIKDYHHFSLKEEIEPIIVRILPPTFDYFAVRASTAEMDGVLAHLERTWGRLYPGYPFEYFLLDDDFDTQYAAEDQLTRIFGTFAFIAILIACLGLFGLASFVTTQRTKEIGVRKVLGASVGAIVLLLSRDFAKLVLIALVVAAPLAYFAMDRWLDDFPYRVGITPAVFLIAGFAALLIAVLTISFQSVKAALSDPVKSLRYE